MNDVRVTYNDYEIPNFFDKFSFTKNYTTVNFSCHFIILADSESQLVTKCTEAETKLKDKYKTLSIKFGETQEYTFSHAENTGFLQDSNLTKIASSLATQTSRAYTFSVSLKLPADMQGYDFRQEANISLEKNIQNRLSLSVRGKYTASPAPNLKSAMENYETYGPTWSDSIAQSLLGLGDYELLDESKSYEQENKILSFSRRYQEKLNLSVEYNSYSIPASYNNFHISKNYNQAQFSCEFAIAHTSAETAENYLRQKNKDLRIVFGSGANSYSFSHSGNSGFLAIPNLQLVSNTSDDDSLRFYRFSVTCELPADASGYAYRRDGSFSISYAPTRRRTITFSAKYTAGGSYSALQNWNASGVGAKAWATTILSALGGNYELIGESQRAEMENKLLDGTLVYQEILSNESESTLNVASIVQAQVDYSIQLGQERGLTSVLSNNIDSALPVTVSVNYSAQIDKEQITTDTGIASLYKSTVRPWIVKNSKAVLGITDWQNAGSNYIVSNEQYRVNPTTYAVSGSLTMTAPQTLSSIIQISESLSTMKQTGVVHQKIWNGKPNIYNVYSIGTQTIVRRTTKILKLNDMPSEPSDLGQNHILLDRNTTVERKKIGSGALEGSATINASYAILYIVTFSESWLYVDTGNSYTWG